MNDPKAGFIGKSVERKEDLRFLSGSGQFTDDITLPRQSYGAFVRSPHAHARIRAIDAAAAKAASGVLGIFTGKDMAAVGGLPCGWLINNIDGTPMKEPKHPVLAEDKVRYVGDQVALVVAETLAEARAAAGMVDVDYEVLPAVVDTATADKAKSSVHDMRAGQRLLRLGLRRQGGDRRSLREGCACDEAQSCEQPADPECDRAARRQRRL